MRLVEFFNMTESLTAERLRPEDLTHEDVTAYGLWYHPKTNVVMPAEPTHTMSAIEELGVDLGKYYGPDEEIDLEDANIIGDALAMGWVRIAPYTKESRTVEARTLPEAWAGARLLDYYYNDLSVVNVMVRNPQIAEKLTGKRLYLFLKNGQIPSKFLKEEMRGVRIKTFSPLEGEGTKVVATLVNAEPGEILDMLDKKSQMRGLSFGDSDTYWWDSYEATHEEVWYVLKEIYGKMPVHPWFLEYREGGPPRFAYARMAAEPAERNAGMRNPHISRLIDYIRQARRAA